MPDQDLPGPVASMRRRIAAAAADCNYELLEDLALEGPAGFNFSFGAPEGGPASYWRDKESEGRSAPLATLLKLLKTPHGTVAAPEPPAASDEGSTLPVYKTLYVWPRAAASEKPSDEDWEMLEEVYPEDQIELMRKQSRELGIGYLAYRIGITDAGDWLYFVAGD